VTHAPLLADGNKNYANQQAPILRQLSLAVSYLFFRSAEKGSYGSVFAAVSPKVREDAETYKGAYLNPNIKALRAPNEDVYKEELAKELWQSTEEILTDVGVWENVAPM
jgi:hypothetical protein